MTDGNLSWGEDGHKTKESDKVHSKERKNKDDQNDNNNNMTVWNCLGWVKEKWSVL